MDTTLIKQMLSAGIPFNQTLGLEVVDIGDGVGTVRLPDDPRLRNHVQSQHAGALFTVAEAASGAAIAGALLAANLMGAVTPLAKGAEIAYRKLARGAIDARATLTADRAALAADLASGKAECSVEVTLTDAAGVEVATVKVRWHLRKL